MKIPAVNIDLQWLPAPVPIARARVTAQEWLAAAGAVRDAGGRLLALWGGAPAEGRAVCAAYVIADGLAWLELSLPGQQTRYPDLVPVFPCAARMQRALADLSGLQAQGCQDQRPWLNHGAWPLEHFPLQQGADAVPPFTDSALVDYPFVRVEGDGVHEIAVGPVHAGVIEPGHFRFSVVGEKVLRLEQRLGYTHKGIEQRMTQMPALQGHRLAGRVSGDSTVAYAWAYCMALESAAGCEITPRAASVRALLLERERIANHLGDLGALGNDAAFAFGLAQFSRLREDWLRLSKEAFGHRLMMDCIVPGGVAGDLDQALIDRLRRQCDAIEPEVQNLRAVYEEHAGLQDRFMTTGRVTPALAAQLGLTGLAGRASGQAWDLRSDHPWAPYEQLQVRMATHRNGDVAARVLVRFDEVFESLRLIRAILADLPAGPLRQEVAMPAAASRGAGWVEGWRGELLVVLELDSAARQHRIVRCHCHDPSWQNWPVLEHAVIGNIVPDFPLINKSFNLSYSGQDL
ncbi:MAG: NADH-quinone oxidoreductase subunit C [Rhodoferax sp.]|uniref:hydrogenase large subunit n=1 Tax=Rhodoferax sp. TaxID=50421 RepID=UPI00263661D7|nr:NADH-quinone oxidoreductase subunit C [Rhodoferax sp.]MDD5336050.1 NADH-quinone oxidoreductase subunit C [Rhodoferax sp.]